MILREKPLAYEDFKVMFVSVDEEGGIQLAIGDPWMRAPEAREVAAALIAAADHVDRVNARKERS